MSASIYTAGRFRANLLSNLATIAVLIADGVWFTPYLLDHLGVAPFGLVTLAITLGNHYSGIFIVSVQISLRRFLTIDLRTGNTPMANRTYNTGFWICACIVAASLIALPEITAGLQWYLRERIPESMQDTFHWSLLAILGGMALTVPRCVYGSILYAFNRVDLDNLSQATLVLVRILTVVALFSMATPRVWHVSAGVFAGAITALIAAALFAKLLAPDLKLQRGAFDKVRARELFGLGMSGLVYKISHAMMVGVDLLLVIALLSEEAGGGYALALKWVWLVRLLNDAVVTSLGPMVTGLFSEEKFDQMTDVSLRMVKLMSITLGLVTATLAGLAPALLYVWVGEEFTPLATLIAVMLLTLTPMLPMNGLISQKVAFNKMKVPAAVAAGCALIFPALAVTFAPWDATGLGVAVAQILALGVLNILFIPSYVARLLKIRWYAFYLKMLPGLAACACQFVLARAVCDLYDPDTWLKLAMAGAGLALLYCAGAFLLLFDAEERRLAAVFMRLRRPRA